MRQLALILVLATQATAAQAQDSTWRDHDRAARAARERGDWNDALRHTRIVDSLLHGHPNVALALGRAYIHLGDSALAIASIARYAAMGLTSALPDSEFAGIRTQSPNLLRRLRENSAPVGAPRTVATLPTDDWVAESVAYDARTRRLFVSSVRNGTIVQIDARGRITPFADVVKDTGWSALGLALDSARRRLWVVSEWLPHNRRIARSDSGRAGVFAYDLASGRLLRRLELHGAPGAGHEPGDICVAANGDLFVSDGRAGEIWTARDGVDSLALVVKRGTLVSPQGCAADRAGRLLVADYVLGPVAVDTHTGAVTVLPRARTMAVNGIDGMIRRGDILYGVQNGVNPNRVIAMRLMPAHDSIVSVTVVAQDTTRIREPTHLTTRGSEIVFVGNGGFGDFDANGVPRAGITLRAPAILAVPTSAPSQARH